MASDPRIYLEDILAAVSGIQETLHGANFSEYQRNRSLRRAVEREIEIISEASRRIPDDLKQSEPTIPWRDMAGIGNPSLFVAAWIGAW